MNALLEWISRIFQSWKFWIVIAPWDIGVRVRVGKVAAALQPGLHFRIPMFDEIVLVNTRVRIEPTPTVTVKGAKPGTARVITAQVGYAIVDPVKALLRYSQPGAAVLAMAQSLLAKATACEDATKALNVEFGGHGIEVVYVYCTEDVEVRTYRLLQGGGGIYASGGGVGPAGGPHGVSAY